MSNKSDPLTKGIYDSLGLIVGFVAVFLTIAMLFMAGWERPPIDSTQVGFRGVALEQNVNPRLEEDRIAANVVPEEPWELTLPEEGEPLAGEIYENVQILGHLGDDQFVRLMSAMTEWVSPEQGCAYCHNEENLADDSLYTHVVSRRMLQMNMAINADWTDHVGATGVTCYTCHRGNNVPEEIWFQSPPDTSTVAAAGGAAFAAVLAPIATEHRPRGSRENHRVSSGRQR